MALIRLPFLFLLVLFSRPSWANDRTYAILRQIQGLESLPTSMVRQLEKVSFQVVAKQKGYELILSGKDTPQGSNLNLMAVESEVNRKGDVFRVEARLINVKTKKLVAKAARDNIREEDVVRLYQGALEAIFLEQEDLDEEGKEIPAKDKPLNAKPRPKNLPSTTRLNTPDEPTIDFKKRINDMKMAVDKQIVKVAESKKDEGKNKESTPDNKINSMLKVAQIEGDAPLQKPRNSKVYERKHRLSLAYDQRQIKSVGLIDTTTKATAASLKASGHVPTSLLDGKTAYSYDFAYSKIQGVEIKPPSTYQLGLYASLLLENWTFSAGLFRDASFFINLPDPGQGLQASSITSTWLRLKGEVTLPFSRPWKIGGTWGTAQQVQSSYKPIAAAKEWQGSHIQLDLTPHFVFLTCEFNLMYESLGLSTQGEIPFTFNESRLGLSLRRSI